MNLGRDAEREQRRVVLKCLAELFEQSVQRGDQRLGVHGGEIGDEGAQSLLAEQFPAGAGASLGQTVGIEQQSVARVQDRVGAGEERIGQGSDELSSRSVQVLGLSVTPQDERRGCPPLARWTVKEAGPSVNIP